MTDTLSQKLEALDRGADFTDPNTYAALLYGDEPADSPAPQPDAPQGDTAPAPQATAPAPAPAEAPAAAAAPSPDSSASPAAAETTASEPVDGVLTKDGKRVIPYAVLEETRKTAQANAQRVRDLAEANERLQAELEAQKAGAAPQAPKAAPYTPERIEQVKADFPEMAEMMEAHNRLLEEFQATRSAPAPQAQPKDDGASVVQALIDQHPLLSKWQAKQGIAWARAVEVDSALRDDAVWSAKTEAERFAEVERRVADELGVDIPSPAAAAAPAAPPAAPQTPTTPAAAIKTAAPVLPTLSDFGGQAPAVVHDPLAGLKAGQMVDKAMSMSEEELRRMVGLSY